MQKNEHFVKVSIPTAHAVLAHNDGTLIHWRPDETLPEEEQYAYIFNPVEGFEIK